jgi:signal transduction histidine kinase
VEQNIQPDLPPVLGDPVALCQCVQNLVVNAIKYRGQGNWIGLTSELQGSRDSAREIVIHVQDRGIGIHESELQRVFEPFYRSPEILASHVQGTGLGLTVAQRSIIEMGGELTVASAVGVGSTFTIHLPVAESSRAAPSFPISVSTSEHSR